MLNNAIAAVKSFWNDEEGAAAIEYGLIAALIAVAIITGASLLGTELGALFNRLGTCMKTPSTCTSASIG